MKEHKQVLKSQVCQLDRLFQGPQSVQHKGRSTYKVKRSQMPMMRLNMGCWKSERGQEALPKPAQVRNGSSPWNTKVPTKYVSLFFSETGVQRPSKTGGLLLGLPHYMFQRYPNERSHMKPLYYDSSTISIKLLRMPMPTPQQRHCRSRFTHLQSGQIFFCMTCIFLTSPTTPFKKPGSTSLNPLSWLEVGW